jgi:pimeloyl-ACP methyl ester carboxylesterase
MKEETGRLDGRLAYARLPGKGPGVVFLPGFRSDMQGSKAVALRDHCAAQGRALLRFDYSGHGESVGRFEDGTIGAWAADAIDAFDSLTAGPQVLVGSSMGGWIALLLARHLARIGEIKRLAGLVLIAPAWDMTERLMAHRMTPEIKAILDRDGVHYEPSLYGDPYPITKHLIEEGRNHLIGVETLHLDLPVRILQGMCDPDVPWGHALDLVDLLCCGDVELTLIKGGDHRQSRPEDLRRLESTVAALLAEVQQVR